MNFKVLKYCKNNIVRNHEIILTMSTLLENETNYEVPTLYGFLQVRPTHKPVSAEE